ncbi:MAG: hypothetical protein HY547_03740, partial [Elusimicrobia bacterium]|nr:hypothetical protein [Elusimicrobiota bacterium]
PPTPNPQPISILKCHHCGIRRKVPDACERCQAPKKYLTTKGLGTQRLAEEIKKHLQINPLRLDGDTSRQAAPIYEKFKSGAAQILIGTKLVTKGWHFPKITLAAVLDADNELSMPDFRACERTFQTLLQVAGRSGRGQSPGALWVGTRRSEHYLFESLKTNNIEFFYERELALRRQMRLPPWSRLLAIQIQGKDRAKVEQAADNLLKNFRSQNQAPDLEALGAAPGYYRRLRHFWRFEVMLRLKETSNNFPWDQITAGIAAERRSGVIVRIKPDPENLF